MLNAPFSVACPEQECALFSTIGRMNQHLAVNYITNYFLLLFSREKILSCFFQSLEMV